MEFVKTYLPQGHEKILEVGCGRGELAAALMESGYKVIAIDKNEEAIQAAKGKGVDARVADILEFGTEELFDAVLFTRSLHHIRPLPTLFNKVKSILSERGKLLVEDFAIEEMDEKTAVWFYELKDFARAIAGQSMKSETPGEGPLEIWRKEHHHEPALHTGQEILREMERYFGTVEAQKAPYLYRYFGESSMALPNAETAMQKTYEWETRSIANGQIKPIGLRIISKKYFSYLR